MAEQAGVATAPPPAKLTNPGMTLIKAKTNKTEDGNENTLRTQEGQSEFNFGVDLTDALKRFGNEVVFKLFKKQGVVEAQNIVRRAVENNSSPEGVRASLASWQPGQKATREVDPAQVLRAAIAGMTPDQAKAYFEKVRSEALGKG